MAASAEFQKGHTNMTRFEKGLLQALVAIEVLSAATVVIMRWRDARHESQSTPNQDSGVRPLR